MTSHSNKSALNPIGGLFFLIVQGPEALEEFPFGIRMIVVLEELYFHGCRSLKLIPEGFEGLTCWKKLYMANCEALEEFPYGALEELEH